MRLAFPTSLAYSTVHLHATHIILVIGIGEFTIFTSLSITRVSILPVVMDVRFATLERAAISNR